VRDAKKITQELQRQDEETEVSESIDANNHQEIAEIGNLKLQLMVRRLNYQIFTLLMFVEGLFAGKICVTYYSYFRIMYIQFDHIAINYTEPYQQSNMVRFCFTLDTKSSEFFKCTCTSLELLLYAE
jgi:hypothetical protein